MMILLILGLLLSLLGLAILAIRRKSPITFRRQSLILGIFLTGVVSMLINSCFILRPQRKNPEIDENSMVCYGPPEFFESEPVDTLTAFPDSVFVLPQIEPNVDYGPPPIFPKGTE